MATAVASPNLRSTHRSTRRTLPDTRATVLLLAALAALGQFASNVYTPSLPAVARDLSATVPAAQITFAAFLGAFAVAQLVYGPVADRIGRRPTLFAGLAVFLAGTVGCALAPTLETLIVARMVQAFGAAAGLVVSRAVTRDSFEGAALARTLAAVTIAFALVPGLTPLVGGIVQELGGWRATFWLTLAVGLAVTAWAGRRLPETRDPATGHDRPLAGYASILADRIFLGTTLTIGLVFGAMSAFFAASPALFIDHLGVGPAEYGLYPPLAVTGFIIGGIVVRRVAGRVPPRRIAWIGLAVMAAALVVMLALPVLGVVHKHAFNATMITNVTGLGLFLPTAIAMALQRFPDRAGTAAAMQGFLQMTGGALGATAVGLIQPDLPILAMPATMLGALVLGVLVFALTPAPTEESAR